MVYPVQSWLIIKIGALGDIAMSLAALPVVDQIPGRRITWVVGKNAATLLELTQKIDEIILVDEKALYGGSIIRALGEVFAVWRRLLGRTYDVCLIPYRDWRYHLLRLGARCKIVRSFRGRGLIPGRYHGSEYMRLALGEDPPPCKKEVVFPLLNYQGGTIDQAPDILLAPGGGVSGHTAGRQWPVSHYVAFAHLAHERGFSVGLVGSGQDEDLERYFSDIPVVSYINKTSIKDLLLLLSKCRLLVTHDCGLMHIMVLAQGPMIALFGPTLPSEKVIPSEKIKVLRYPEYLPCRPCYDGKTYSSCKNNVCMNGISPEFVFAESVKLLE